MQNMSVYGVGGAHEIYGSFNPARHAQTADADVSVRRRTHRATAVVETGARRGDATLGAGYWEFVRAGEDLLICAANNYYDEQFRFAFRPGMDVVSIRFLHAGRIALFAAERDPVEVGSRTASLFKFERERDYELSIEERSPLLSVTLHMRERWLRREFSLSGFSGRSWLNGLFAKRGPLALSIPMTAAMSNCVIDIIACQLTGDARRRYTELKAGELLLLMAQSLDEAERAPPSRSSCNAHQRDRLFAARDMLLAEITKPPSVEAIARAVGLNRTTLRKGFREVFDQTMSQFVFAHRMRHARDLLRHENHSIAEIAAMVGYDQPGNFSVAFKRHFSASPRHFRQ